MRMLSTIGLSMLLLVGCSSTSASDTMLERINATEVSQDTVSMNQYVSVSNLGVRLTGKVSNGLYYVTGKITNEHNSVSIDKVVDMVILDENGGVIMVRPHRLNVGPGQSVFFDELAGQTVNINKPFQVEIMGVD